MNNWKSHVLLPNHSFWQHKNVLHCDFCVTDVNCEQRTSHMRVQKSSLNSGQPFRDTGN